MAAAAASPAASLPSNSSHEKRRPSVMGEYGLKSTSITLPYTERVKEREREKERERKRERVREKERE